MADTRGTSYPGIRQLRLFLLLAEELHFGRAARRAYLAQPTFSRHIRSLERQLGAELVDRTTRRTELTDAGRALLPRIREVVDAAERLRTSARHHAAAGRMVIGSFEAVTSMDPVPAIMDELHRLIPDVDVQVLRTGFDSATAILRGDVDASFVFLPVPEGIQTCTLAAGARCAAMSSSDPLVSEGPLRLSDLSDHEHIGFGPDIPAVWRDFWSVNPRPDGTAVRYSPHAVTDYESALVLIAMGKGIQLPPESARWLYPRSGVAYVDVVDLEPWRLALAWLPKNRDKPTVAALRQATRTVLRRQADLWPWSAPVRWCHHGWRAGEAHLRTEGESVADRKNQMIVLGVVVVGVLWINGRGDVETDGDGKSPNPRQTGRYPVHFQNDGGKKDTGKNTKKPVPRSTVSYPIKFDRK
ncbi:LysR family transcriptional regulator [Streptomyces botrytidirepellens]|nr:LysR family transcriptional regulator [Streptomyces botrytidirepellens]